MRKGSKMTKAQRIKHGKAIKAGWARRKQGGPISPPLPTLRERIAAIVREEVDKRLDELFA